MEREDCTRGDGPCRCFSLHKSAISALAMPDAHHPDDSVTVRMFVTADIFVRVIQGGLHLSVHCFLFFFPSLEEYKVRG